MSLNIEQKAAPPPVGLGQIRIGRESDELVTILGSCIGVVLYSPCERLGALAHVVLPRAGVCNEHPGRFADTAVPAMLADLKRAGTRIENLRAKLVGGANMFPGKGPMQVGEDNLLAARKALADLGIPIVAEDVGGKQGRRMTLRMSDGQVRIEIVGGQSRVI